jgi:hypothetical protein
MAHYEGVSSASEEGAGFRAATAAAVETYKQANGAPQAGTPVRLRVAEMYVNVQNPIHEFIVVLEPQH